MAFKSLIELLQNIFYTLLDFLRPLLDFLSYEIGFGDLKFSILTVLFSTGFTAWLIYKALPAT